MSQHSQKFIDYLLKLAEHNRGALAILRRSLGFESGGYPPAYPYIEVFVGEDREASDPYRRALYLAAGLFALHPLHSETTSFASAFGESASKRGSGSIEKRFIALLGAEPENLANYLRQAISLLAADRLPLNYARLSDAIALWFKAGNYERRDKLRQEWARDFYRAYNPLLKDQQTSKEQPE